MVWTSFMLPMSKTCTRSSKTATNRFRLTCSTHTHTHTHTKTTGQQKDKESHNQRPVQRTLTASTESWKGSSQMTLWRLVLATWTRRGDWCACSPLPTRTICTNTQDKPITRSLTHTRSLALTEPSAFCSLYPTCRPHRRVKRVRRAK